MSNAVSLNRRTSKQTATIALNATESSAIVLDGFAIGMIYLPSTFDGTALTFTVCDALGGTYVAYEDASGAAVSLTVEASKAYALPEGLFGAPFAKLVAGSAQETTATVIPVTLKG